MVTKRLDSSRCLPLSLRVFPSRRMIMPSWYLMTLPRSITITILLQKNKNHYTLTLPHSIREVGNQHTLLQRMTLSFSVFRYSLSVLQDTLLQKLVVTCPSPTPTLTSVQLLSNQLDSETKHSIEMM